ncbi:MAG: ATP-binding protein [Caulobacter sp.]|nr:ATP-binding protein [Caulobacter sp.]
MNQPATLHLICGLPGSGKSTLARRLAGETGALRLSSDVWLKALEADGYDIVARARVEALQWDLATELLGRGVSVILEAGFWTRAERDVCRAGAAAARATAVLHFCDAPVEELQRRVAARNADLPADSYRVNADDIPDWVPLFERPGADELD